jgi:PAS domain S-box-containing protein
MSSRSTPQSGSTPAGGSPDEPGKTGAAAWLQASSMQLGLMVGLVGIITYRIDLPRQRIQLNDWGYELFGIEPDPDGLPMAFIRDRTHPDDLPMVKQAADLAAASAGIVDTEARYLCHDGSYRTLLTRRTAERNAQGETIALVGVSMDITQQVQEREHAKAAAQSIELIAEATGVGVWSIDVAARHTTWNGQIRRIFGIADDMPLPEARRLAVALTDPADRERMDDVYRRLVAGEAGPIEMEFRIHRPDGQPRWVVMRAQAAMRAGRQVLFGVFIDVTDPRTTEERLRRAEERTLMAAKAVGLAMWERDLVTGDSWWDAQMYRLRGLVPDESGAPNDLRHRSIHPDDVPEVERRTARIIERERDYHFDFRVVWPDGSVHWLATRGSVVRDDEGKALRIIGFNWDITEHKVREEMLRERAGAEQASRAKTEFLSRMSHELRTPLNAVLGFAQVMLDDGSLPLPGRQRERAAHIHEAGKHLLALIDDVLDLTSLEASELSLTPVAIAPLVHDTVLWVEPAAQAAQVSIRQGTLTGAVMADARRLRQVLANLLTNAVKYNHAGGRVQLDAVPGTGANAGLLGIRVKDSGRGLTPQQMQRLFEPFNRLGAEREGIEGTGIGLTIVRSLVQRMQGRVEVNSRAGQGTEFVVWLPITTAAAPPADEAQTRPAQPHELPPAIDVLYIEDNAVNVMLVQEIVGMRDNVTLHVAVDGRSGIASALALKPRAVLIDLQLPDMDGFAVLRALRADASMEGVAMIALSANAMPEDIEKARRLGFDDYWTKPIDFRKFLAGLDRLAGSG